jgi:hypothetical protein
MIFGLQQLLIKPGCGRPSDRHGNSDSQARATLKIISNNPDVHPCGCDPGGNVGGGGLHC